LKRTDLIRELEKRGRVFIRHGGKHDWYQNPKSKTAQPIPRHKEVKNPAAETTGCTIYQEYLDNKRFLTNN
jgi:predicted RNA binding protein YcfA (HicA-like mRNA interferase family)